MGTTAILDDIPRPVWVVLTILGFILWWPVGLALLAFLLWSRRMGCWGHGHWERRGTGCWSFPDHRGRRSGNRAFDEYRAETLKRLEEEEQEFRQFLGRLRFAKDKAEFDQFLAERRNRPPEPEAPPPQA